ncbi:hypothetical protein [uncultured Lutibacter sp.]|uniref:hypothetical protein n=1 Tax=uncultured Lutibacter sp. TaxID=437739 RepID=UPI00263A2F39|nr:hypothetical protein [uncultured Lutibacter sp.]
MIFKKSKKLLLIFLILFISVFGVLNYQNQILRLVYHNKIWVHRVNELEKYSKARNFFEGVELDVVYDVKSKMFDVRHPPAPSISLNLWNYFKSEKIDDNFGFWLDFKNLDSTNFKQSSNLLDSITKTLNIKSGNIIVESVKPEYLYVFSEKGFQTSYYLPSKLSELDNNNLTEQILIIKNKIMLNKTDYISANAKDFKVMKLNFKDCKILVWNIINDPPKINSLYRLKIAIVKLYNKMKILGDENVKVVLVDL